MSNEVKWHFEHNKVGRPCYRLSVGKEETVAYVMDYRPGRPPWLGLPYFPPYGKHWYPTLKKAKDGMVTMYVESKLD